MQFLYFVETRKAMLTPAELDAIGLGHVHDGIGVQCLSSVRFKDATGLFVMVADSVPGEALAGKLGYKPDAQTWRPGPSRDGKPLYHVGFWNDQKPTAASLARRKPIGGVPVTLLDGGQWMIPVAMAKSGMTSLPLVMDIDEAGKWGGRTRPEYEHLCGLARSAYESLLDVYLGRTSTVEFDKAMAIVVAALAASYRVGSAEIAALALVGDETIGEVMEAVCEWSLFREGLDHRLGELVARRASGSSPIDSGSADASPGVYEPSWETSRS